MTVIISLMARTLATNQQKIIVLSAATGTQASSLLDVLNPTFEKNTGYFVEAITAGPGHETRSHIL